MFALDVAETLLKYKKHRLGETGLENSPSDIIDVNCGAGVRLHITKVRGQCVKTSSQKGNKRQPQGKTHGGEVIRIKYSVSKERE